VTAKPSSPTPRWVVVTLAVILTAGAILRGAYLRDLQRDPMFLHPVLDAELHDYWARGLATGNWTPPPNRPDPSIPTTPYFRPPGYPYVLSAIYRLTGEDPTATRWVQFGLGLSTCLIAFALGRRLYGDVAGLAAAGLVAVDWPLIFFEGELLDASLLATLILGAMLLTLRAGDRPTAGRGAAAGVVLGFAVLVRANALPVVAAAAIWVLWAARRRRVEGAPRTAAALLLCAFLAILPATLRNYHVSGEWVLLSANGGINFFIGNNPEADGVRAAVPGVHELTGQRGWTCFDYPRLVKGLSRRVGRPLGYAEASSIWAARGWEWIRGNPKAFAALTAKRAALFLGPRELGDRDVDLARQASPVLRRLPISFPIVLALAIVGFGVILKSARKFSRRFEEAVLLAGGGGVYVMSFLPFFFNARYRIPVAAILIVLAGTAVARLVEASRGRAWRTVAWVAVPVVVLAAAASVDLVGVPRALDEWHYQRGTAYRDAGRPQEAMLEFEEAIRVRPRSALVRNDLALLLRDQGRLAEAIAQWNVALDADPSWFEARFNRAQVMAAQGRFAAAIPEYQRVLSDEPDDANAHLSLGAALLRTGHEAPGLAQYREAERLAPDDPLVAYVIGRDLLARGRLAEGRAELQRALRLDPRYEPARRALHASESSEAAAAAPR